MSRAYDEYLVEHRENVAKGFEWFATNMPEIFPPHVYPQLCDAIRYEHDCSKDDPEEYFAYDAYFYEKRRTKKVIADFNKAWLRHIHLNPHHWQHWVLIHDDAPEEALEMPEKYVIEMICDWWSFSWKTGKMTEIFDWYEKHKDMKLHSNTRQLVELILSKMKEKLEEQE